MHGEQDNIRISSFQDQLKYRVAGVFIDQTTSAWRSIASLGVAAELGHVDVGKEGQGRISLPVLPPKESDPTYFPNKFRHRAFFSKASLVNVKTIKSQTRDWRCVGLLVEHGDGGIPEVLGQWDPAGTNVTTKTLYERDSQSGHQSLNSLTFRYAKVEGGSPSCCDGIVANMYSPSPQGWFTWEDCDRVGVEKEQHSGELALLLLMIIF